MKRMDKDWGRIKMSGICHHMIFETKYLNEIISKIEKPQRFILQCIFKIVEKKPAWASEYEIYFNYMLKYYPNHIIIRKLNWKNNVKNWETK